ncbi:MAG TPA: hypothetical protein DCP07_08165 [Lachnospiraceae bacterium]|nr:hypothetical protein [Lachnospiraceae bacterium]
MTNTPVVNKKNKKRGEILGIVALSTLFIAFSVIQDIVRIDIMPDSLRGVLSSMQILLAMSMVVISVTGYRVAIILMILSFIPRFIMLLNNNNSVLPGVSISIVGIATILIVHLYLVSLEKKERELFALAHTDALTDLPNRRSLKQKMLSLISNSRNSNGRFAVAMIDLDNFKNINDTIGHDWGDKVLSEIAVRWKSIVTENDYICRLGGDDFALVVNNYKSLEELDNHLHQFLDKVMEKFILKGKDYFVTASMGVSIFPNDSIETSQLLKYADMAMFVAKNQGKKRLVYFDNMMNDAVENNVEVEHVIRRALETDTFRLVYQPQFDIKTKKLRGFETLIRLSDSEGKQVSPADFVPIAEKSSLIIDVDKWVLRHAMMDFLPFVEKIPEMILSVNISANHILDDSFIGDIDRILEDTHFPEKNLEIELTESVFVNSLERAKTIMEKLKDRGIKIALDDFGTGYSSLSYMRDLPFDLLKIDKSFVDTINDGPKEESFVAAIISLGKVMQFDIISEGVEEQNQLDVLKKLGCDFVQGYIWGKPLSLDRAIEVMAQN